MRWCRQRNFTLIFGTLVFVEGTFKDREDIIQHLVDEADVNELVQSILSAGYVDYEPLIVERKTNVVLEGNRRLAAVHLIADAALRKRVKYDLPEIESAHKAAEVGPSALR